MASVVSTHQVQVGTDVVVKTFRTADRDEPAREWRALQILAEQAPGLAPTPLARNDAPPSITMSRLPGVPLGGALTDEQVTALTAAIDRVFRLPEQAVPQHQSLGHPGRHLTRIRAEFPATVAAESEPVVRQAHAAAARWLAGTDPTRLVGGTAPAVLARGDYNLSNFLWDGESVRMLDFEDSGAGDRGMELGLLLEHIGCRDTPDYRWDRLVESFELTPDEQWRMLATRRAEAIFWFSMLQPGGAAAGRNPPGTLQRQAERLSALLLVD